jgi:hypothetical protein
VGSNTPSPNNNARLRLGLKVLGIVLISAPVSIVITILLLPLWSWIEASTGIESVGHSGPDEWCYLAIFIVVITGALMLLFASHRRKRSRA